MSGWMHWMFHAVLTVKFSMLVLRSYEKQVSPYCWVNRGVSYTTPSLLLDEIGQSHDT